MKDKASEQQAQKVIEELLRLRKAQGLSHEKLADRVGLNRSTISLIENSKRNPTLINCMKLAKALGVRLGDVLNKFEK